jgi:hypothetical protein
MKVVSRQWSVVSKSVVVLALCALLFALYVPAWAQQAKKVARIGYLAATTQLLSLTVPRPFGRLCASLVV